MKRVRTNTSAFQKRETCKRRRKKEQSRTKEYLLPSKKAAIRVGDDFQAVIPDVVSTASSEDVLPERSGVLCLWSPTEKISPEKLQDYIYLAKDIYGCDEQQALGVLKWYEHDLQKAIENLANFRPMPPLRTKK